MGIYLRIIDTSAIMPLVERLAEQQPPWFSKRELLRAWFTYHLQDLQSVIVGSAADRQLVESLSTQFFLANDFAIERLYKNSQHVLPPYVNKCFHEHAELMIMPTSVILVYRLRKGARLK